MPRRLPKSWHAHNLRDTFAPRGLPGRNSGLPLLNSSGGNTQFTGVDAPFLATDLVEIEIPGQYIGANGEFDPKEVQFTRVTVVRDGVRHDFDDQSGSKIKETGPGPNPKAPAMGLSACASVFPPAGVR